MTLSGYIVPLGCPRCGSAMEHRESHPTLLRDYSGAFCWCPECLRIFQVDVFLIEVEDLSAPFVHDREAEARERAGAGLGQLEVFS